VSGPRLGAVGCLLLLGCSGPRPGFGGPAPQYEPPRILPWDAGVEGPEPDPFAAAAEGEWVAAEPSRADAASGEHPEGTAGKGPVSLDGAAGRAVN